MTTLIINQKTENGFSLTGSLLDPELMDNDNLEDAENTLQKTKTAVAAPANVYETEEAYELEILAPGLNGDNITIDVDDDSILTVAATVDDLENNELADCRRREFSSTDFSRSFELPEDADAEEITGEYKNGIVYLTIPKMEERESQIIEIFED